MSRSRRPGARMLAFPVFRVAPVPEGLLQRRSPAPQIGGPEQLTLALFPEDTFEPEALIAPGVLVARLTSDLMRFCKIVDALTDRERYDWLCQVHHVELSPRIAALEAIVAQRQAARQADLQQRSA